MKRKREHKVHKKDEEESLKKKRKIISKELKLELVRNFKTLKVSSDYLFSNLWLQKMICEEGGYKWTHWRNKPSFEVSDDEIVEKIFPKKSTRKYEIHLKEVIEKIKMTEIKEIMNKYWDKIVLDDSIKKPKYKTEISGWIVSVVFEKISYFEKRKIETENFDKNQRLFVSFGDIVLPEEIILKILEYSTKDKRFLDGVGLINSKFYLLCLRSWSKIRIRKENIKLIPIIVLYYSKNISIHYSASKDFLVSEFKYIFNQTQNLRSLNITGGSSTFFSRLEKVGIVLSRCVSCCFIPKISFPFGTGKELCFPIENFPKLTKIRFNLACFGSYKFFKKIRRIVIKRNSFLVEHQKTQIFENILKNINYDILESFNIGDLRIPISFEGLEEMESIRKFGVYFHKYMISSVICFEKNFFLKIKKVQSISFSGLASKRVIRTPKYKNELIIKFNGLSKLQELKTITINFENEYLKDISFGLFEKIFKETISFKNFDCINLRADTTLWKWKMAWGTSNKEIIGKKKEELKILCQKYNFVFIDNPNSLKEFIKFKRI